MIELATKGIIFSGPLTIKVEYIYILEGEIIEEQALEGTINEN